MLYPITAKTPTTDAPLRAYPAPGVLWYSGRPRRASRAILKGAHIEGAHLEGTNLRPYLLAGDTDKFYDVGHLTIAEASEGGLTQDQIEQAYGDEHTLLPPDLEPPAHWGVKPDRTN